MDKLRNLAIKGVKKFCPGSDSGSKKRITSGRGSSSSRYTRVPSPPVPLGTPFEEEIGVGAHDMDYVEARKNYGIEEENEVDAVNLDEDNENIAETPAVGDANVRSESVNLPFRPPSSPKPRKRTGIAWQFFERISDIEVQCNICQQIYKHRSGGKQGGTGTLMRHIAEDHKRELNIAKGVGDVGGSTQTRMDPAIGHVAKKYNKLRDREEIAKMVAVGCLPFSFPSSDAFIRYIQAIYNPMFNGIPRTTCRSDIFRLHSQYCFYLSTLLKNIQCRLSLTSDLGRSVNKNDYLTVTCHWMDSNFVMQKHILVFLYDEDRKDTGQFIADSIVKIAGYYGSKIKFYLYIEKIRLAVGFIQGNNRRSRIREFKVKCQENELTPILMPEEIDTRWSSTYEFLKTCYKYRISITLAFNQHCGSFVDSADCMLHNSDWDVINDLVKFLENFYVTTVEFSGAYYPTVCNILAYIADISGLLKEYKNKEGYKEAVGVMFTKLKKYFFPIPPIYLVGAMLNPCMKYNHMCHFSTLIYTNLEINTNHDSEQVQPDLWTATADAKDYIEKLYNHYADLFDLAVPTNITPTVAPHPPEEPSSSKRPAQSGFSDSFYDLNCWNSVDERTYTSTYREELKYYLRTAPEDRRRRINTLDWWRSNETQYPVLSRLARDILIVPMSTVTSESAFSQGRQQLGDNQHSLGSNAMNVLVCLRDWIRAERRNQGMEPEPSDELKLEEIMTSRENAAESSPMHGFAPVDFDYPMQVPININMNELEKMMHNL
ncbi:hypothetical protein P3S67_028178 [Capsicum chacoense]